jgi:hypothetical protein
MDCVRAGGGVEDARELFEKLGRIDDLGSVRSLYLEHKNED